MDTSIVDRCDFNVGDYLDGKYRVHKVLGEGSFGKVYQVKDGSGKDYALKLLRLWEVAPDIRPDLIQRFEVEFKTGQIDSDYLVKSYEYQFVKGNPYIIMDFCPGGDLTERLGKSYDSAPLICQQILLGLHALHMQGKVHRDLKPENILFKADGTAVLTDFGIIGDKNHRMTQRSIFGRPNQVFGTYAYMPPEQSNRSRGGVTVLPTTDIFSFGVLAYQLLTNKYPFGELTSHNELAEYQRRVKNGEWDKTPLNTLQDASQWKNLFAKCLHPNFKERFQSVEEVLQALPKVTTPILKVPDLHIHTSSGYCLRVLTGEDYGNKYNLKELGRNGQKIFTLGREDNNTISIRETLSSYISRYHCCLEKSKDNAWIIRDGQWHNDTHTWENSSNGTFVNSTEISSLGYLLSNGDIITIGETKLRFENF